MSHAVSWGTWVTDYHRIQVDSTVCKFDGGRWRFRWYRRRPSKLPTGRVTHTYVTYADIHSTVIKSWQQLSPLFIITIYTFDFRCLDMSSVHQIERCTKPSALPTRASDRRQCCQCYLSPFFLPVILLFHIVNVVSYSMCLFRKLYRRCGLSNFIARIIFSWVEKYSFFT